MKKLSLCLLCIFALAWPDLLFAAGEAVSFSYVCQDLKGADRWRADARIENLGSDIYLMTERAHGVYSSFNGRISWVAEMKFKGTRDSVKPVSLDKRVFDAKGRMIRRERQEFDLAGNTGICTHEDPLKNILSTKKFKFNKDVVTRLSLGFYAIKFIESGKRSVELQMVSEEPSIYNIKLKRMGKETIDLNGRKVEAYRLSIEPELGALNFIKVILPRSYAWHSAVPKYEWLGYAGLEGGINSEKVEIFIEDIGDIGRDIEDGPEKADIDSSRRTRGA